MKRQWIARFLSCTICLGLLSGCGDTTEQVQQEVFTLQVAMVGEVNRLDPIYATEVVEQTLLTSLYDNLMTQTVDSEGNVSVEPGLAKTVETTENADGSTTYTFTLRRAYWSDGETVTAHDFVYAWKRLADPVSASPYQSLLSMISGYDQLMETNSTSVLAISAPEDDVFEVVITGENDWFLQEVCTAIATLPVRQDVLEDLKEAASEGESWASNLTSLVTCGSYIITAYDDDSVSLSAYEDHYAKVTGAQEIQVLLAPDVDTAWTWYDQQTLSLTWPVPDDIYTQLLEQETAYAVAPTLEMTYVAINNQDEILQDFAVRQALSNAVDFTAVAQAVGMQTQVAQGIVPQGIAEEGQEDGFRHAGATLDTDPDTYAQRQMDAQLSLAQSTYPVDMVDYTLELLYVDQDDNQTVAAALCQQWYTTLGITVTPVATDSWDLSQAMAQGTYQLALCDLKAVANDPEPYLSPWVSSSSFNTIGYADSAYDTLLTIAATAAETSGRVGCLHDAEALLLEDYALIPLYTSQTAWLLNEELTNLTRDSRGWFFFDTITPRT